MIWDILLTFPESGYDLSGARQKKSSGSKLRPSVMLDIRIWSDFWVTALREATGDFLFNCVN